jgi:hypothetical protein
MCGHVGVAGDLALKDEALMKRLLIFDYLRGPDSTGLAAIETTATPASPRLPATRLTSSIRRGSSRHSPGLSRRRSSATTGSPLAASSTRSTPTRISSNTSSVHTTAPLKPRTSGHSKTPLARSSMSIVRRCSRLLPSSASKPSFRCLPRATSPPTAARGHSSGMTRTKAR